MGRTNLTYCTSTTVFKLVFLCILWVQLSCVQCHGRIIKDTSTEPTAPPSPPQFKNRFQRIFLSILFGIFAGLICALVFAWFVRSFVRYINKAPILKGPVVFSPKIPAKTLQSALAIDTQLLGGKYYRTVLDNGLTVAVKRLEPFESGDLQGKSSKRRIQQELEVIASLRHRNLMSLRAYVRESNRFFLVYDYVPNGSLEDAMNKVRENQLQLSWELRLRIAVGVVKGLQYLHFSCNPRILHRNLKPTNVMLDAEFEPRLADCGLAKIIPTLNLPAASTYAPPESFQSCSRYTDKSDVFSFGVILGVLLTGKYPTDPFFGDTSTGGSLGRWLQRLQEAGDAREALDKNILGEEIEEDEMLMAVKIAVVCLSDMPADRPSSDELVSMLTQLNSF
ncbi:inactive leucine-rich repeat receptor-like protein kinase CORYNE isoform X1 [Lycium barbarum]|uniref:inactive leucine-rich repeat receptor-like protein kinase CORYNE isoform X1 n=1 Tax=Lycium barbarum TaxID=112863 RepID=UPI00293E722C|nr:inactive leucine-rich repeat receptor-like protein kinase CORYNE isoform X1 [Lycium barbarum]